MSLLHNQPPPPDEQPGWYTDPLGSNRLRYWHGNWTDRIEEIPTPPLSESKPLPLSSKKLVRESHAPPSLPPTHAVKEEKSVATEHQVVKNDEEKRRGGPLELGIAVAICLVIGLAYPPLGLIMLAIGIVVFIFWGGLFTLLFGGVAAWMRHENKKAEEIEVKRTHEDAD